MSKDTDADIAFIRALAEILRESDLTEIEVSREYGEDDELTVRLCRQAAPAPAAAPVPPPAHAPAAAAAPAAPTPSQPAAEGVEPAAPVEETAEPITSPMVGTAYLAAEPGADPFVQVGDKVSEGQTLLIIEAMKTMNQIPSPVSGTVRAILVSNAEPVEYGAPLMVVA
jgi:acetyl-CoA carboxylase biotin carboxyl carrier protein